MIGEKGSEVKLGWRVFELRGISMDTCGRGVGRNVGWDGMG